MNSEFFNLSHDGYISSLRIKIKLEDVPPETVSIFTRFIEG